MKCEICGKNEAGTAIPGPGGGEDSELYVCEECARAEKLKRQKKSQRTRKQGGLPPGGSISVSGFGPAVEPPNAITGEPAAADGAKDESGQPPRQRKSQKRGEKRRGREDGGGDGENADREYFDIPISDVDPDYVMRDGLQLEALHLTGELGEMLDAAERAGVRFEGLSAEGLDEVGHVYYPKHSGDEKKARRILRQVLMRELSARNALRDEMSRTYEDALCRALAILKNARYISPGEYVDLLSPLRLGAIDGLLDGIGRDEIEREIGEASLDEGEPQEQFSESYDEIDGSVADSANSRFEDVVLNDKAEEMFR